MKRIKVLIITSLILISLSSCKREDRRFNDFIENDFKINFSGIVLNSEIIEKGVGIVCLDLSYSSVDSYNDKIEGKYFCELNNGFCKLLTHTRNIKINDSLVVNKNNNKELIVYRNNKAVWSYKISIINGYFVKLFSEEKTKSCPSPSSR